MTAAQDQQSRDPAFVAWATDRRLMEVSHGIRCEWAGLHLAYEAWQAARALPAGVEPAAWRYQPRDGLKYPAFIESENVAIGYGKAGSVGALYTAAQVLAMGRVAPGWQQPLATALGHYQHARDVIGGCTDGGCIIKKPKGMHTNGGCKCLRAQHVAQAMVHWGNELAKAVEVALAAAPRPPAAQADMGMPIAAAQERMPLTLDEFRKAFHAYTGCIVGTNQGLLMAAKAATEHAHGIKGAA